jgi:hypothetical protein
MLLLVPVLVLLGAGAALLVDPTVSSTSSATGTSPPISISLPPALWGALFLAPVLVGFAGFVLRGIFGSDSAAIFAGERRGVGVVVLVVAVTLLLFGPLLTTLWSGTSEVTIRDGGGSGPFDGGTGTSGSNGTGGSGTGGHDGNGTDNGTSGTGNGTGGQGNGTGAGGGNGTGGSGGGSSGGGGNGSRSNDTNTTNGTGGSGIGGHGPPGGHGNGTGSANNSTGLLAGTHPPGAVSVGIPNWVLLVVAVGLSAVVGVLAIPGVLSRLLDRRRRSSALGTAERAEVRAVFRDARLAIERGESPRDAIVRLYGRLIGRIVPVSSDLAASTAREIQRTRLAQLHVLPERSEAITLMFEEACYSAHPIGPASVDRFVETLRSVDLDLSVGATR